MTRVADVMSSETLSVSPDTPVRGAALEMVLRGIHGAPVRDMSGQVIGVLSTTDLVDPRKPADESQRAADAMSPVLFAVRDSEHVMYAIQRMLETGTHRLVVIDGRGELAGMITPFDVMRAVHEGKDLRAGWTG